MGKIPNWTLNHVNYPRYFWYHDETDATVALKRGSRQEGSTVFIRPHVGGRQRIDIIRRDRVILADVFEIRVGEETVTVPVHQVSSSNPVKYGHRLAVQYMSTHRDGEAIDTIEDVIVYE